MNDFGKKLLLHIKYPYTAIVIAIIWIGTALIVNLQENPQVEILVITTAIVSLIIAAIGFSSPK